MSEAETRRLQPMPDEDFGVVAEEAPPAENAYPLLAEAAAKLLELIERGDPSLPWEPVLPAQEVVMPRGGNWTGSSPGILQLPHGALKALVWKRGDARGYGLELQDPAGRSLESHYTEDPTELVARAVAAVEKQLESSLAERSRAVMDDIRGL